MVVSEHRIAQREESGRKRRIIIVRALANPPPIVATALPSWLVVDLLVVIVSNISYEHRASSRIKRKLPRIAKAERPDLRRRAGDIHERVVQRHPETLGIRVVNANVDAQNLAKQAARILGLVQRIPGVGRISAAVTGRDVEISIRPEHQMAGSVEIECLTNETLAPRPLQIETRAGICDAVDRASNGGT